MSVAPPVPGHLHTLDLPTSGIDDEPLAPTAVYPENEAPKLQITPGVAETKPLGYSTPKYMRRASR